ncbi:hypothetical protein ABBQ38_012232 [Trebouxia sp. C0009 RCD-2024]
MAALVKSLGTAIRTAGQAIDSMGAAMQGKYAYRETLSKHKTLQPFNSKKPQLAEDIFVAPNSSMIGDVSLGKSSSVWYGAVLRGDVNSIKIGENSNIQDNCIVHVAKHNAQDRALPTIIGNNVTIGHSATIHACTVEDNSLVGMKATLLDGVTVQKGSMVAAGSLVPPNTTVPTGEIWAGNPARKLRELDAEEAEFILQSAVNYSALARIHAAENAKTHEEIEADKDAREDRLQRDPDYDSHLGIERDPITREITHVAAST